MVQTNNVLMTWRGQMLKRVFFTGFRALSEAYLDAAKTTEEGTQEDTEELYLLAAKMVMKKETCFIYQHLIFGTTACLYG